MSEYLSTDPNAGLGDYLSTDPNEGLDTTKKRKTVPEMTVGSVAQDLVSGALQIGPTAVKGVADIARLATGDRLGKDTSEAMERGITSIQDVIGSDRAAAQRQNFEADMADESVNAWDTIKNNKGALADMVLPTVGSMFLPVGVAGAAGKVATMGKAAQAMQKAALADRVAKVQKVAGIGTIAAQNAAQTFVDMLDAGETMPDAYLAAGITVPFSVVAGALTGGGAEGAITRAMTGTGAFKAGVGEVLKASGREGAQEMGEELGQITGKAVATEEMPTFNSASKQLSVAGTLGAVMGGGVDVARQAGRFGKPQAQTGPAVTPPAPAGTPPVQPQPTQPTAQPTDSGLADALDAADLVADEAAPEGAPTWTAPAQPTTMQAPSMDTPVSVVPTNHFGTPLSMGDPVSIIPTATIAQRRDEAATPEDRQAIELEMQRRGLPGATDGATDQGGQISPVAAQGVEGASADVPGSGDDPQAGLPGGLAGGSGSAAVPGSADGSVVPAGDAGAFDVSGRTDAQLDVLVKTGKPGWREAAIAEVARRNPASLPVESAARTLDEEGRATDGKPINPGDVFRTLSGRNATPYPKQKGQKYASQWLIDNATAEAESRGDDFNARTFKNSKPLKDGTLTDADREGMLMYLFSQQPDVVPSILKPLTGEPLAPQPSQPAQKASQAQGAEGKAEGVTYGPEVDDWIRDSVEFIRGGKWRSADLPGEVFSQRDEKPENIYLDRIANQNKTVQVSQPASVKTDEVSAPAEAKRDTRDKLKAEVEKAKAKRDQPSAEALADLGLYREYGGKHQYRMARKDGTVSGGWFTSNSRADAIEMATKAHDRMPPESRLTSAQRDAKADAEYDAVSEQRYGKLKTDELRAEVDRLTGEIASLQKAGKREFNGNGGRRTGAAVSNEGARVAGEEKMRLERLIKQREATETQATAESFSWDTLYPSVSAAQKAIKAYKLKQVGVFASGDQYRIGAKSKRTVKESNNLLQRIKQLGGIRTRYRSDVIGDKTGAPGLFSNTGKGLDDLATELQADGFDIDTDTVDGGVEILTDLIQRAVMGETILNFEGQERAAQKRQNDEYRDNLKEEIDTLGGNPARSLSTPKLIEMRDKLRDEVESAKAAQAETIIGEELTDAEWDAILNAPQRSLDEYASDLDQAAFMQREQEENDAAYRRYEEETQEAAGQRAGEGSRQGAEAGRAEPGNQEAQVLVLTGETPAEVKAKEEAQAAQAKAEKDAADKAEAEAKKKRIAKEDADRKAIVMAEREAAKKAEVDAAVENYALGQEPPKPVEKAVNKDQLAGQGGLFAQPAEQQKPSKPAVSSNTIFTEDAAAAARARLKAKLGRLNSGLDPETMLDGITLAGYHIEAGARTFAAYAKAMIEDLGDAVKPYLKSWYAAVSMDPRASGFDGLDDLATVQSADIEAILKETGDTNEPLQPKSVPEKDTRSPEQNAAAGNRNSEQMGAGMAKSGASPDQGGQVSVEPGVAGNDGARGSEQTGEQSPGKTRNSVAVRSERKPASDHVIDSDEIGKGGLTKKYRDNVAAIRVLKQMEAEDRVATPEERKVLAKYVGWGAMKGPFDPTNKAWEKQHAELRELLTDAEFRAARASTLDAHYTSPVVVHAMNDALSRLGYKGGRMLESSVGIGNFFGMMPTDMRNKSQLHGVELDSLTSRMVAALYPKAKIAKATGFQDYDVPAGFFDLSQGNPPFGNSPIVDKSRSPYSGFSTHNYFIAKQIDLVRPGGIVQVVVSHNFMDAQDSRVREWVAKRASLIGAVRLPNTAFKENAGTEVVTDILIFQKHDLNGLPTSFKFTESVDQVNTNKNGESITHKVNQFFVSNPKLVLGKPSAAGTMYSANEYTVEQDGDIKELLAQWVKTLPENIYQPIDRTREVSNVDMSVPDGVKVGSFYVGKDGEVMQRGDDLLGEKTAQAWIPPNQTAVARMKGMIVLRDTLRAQMRLERSPDATEKEIEANRAALNRAYDDFLKKFKHLNNDTNRRIFLDDPESNLIQGLEFDYDKGISDAKAEKEGIEPRKARANKADIFERRVAFPPMEHMTVSTAKDALLASLNYRGGVDVDYMQEVYGKPADQIIEELGDVVFDDPQNGIVAADEYLSGDVKTKLEEAKLAARDNTKYRRNVEALEKVIPKDKTPSEISVSLGNAFVPAEIYEQFVRHISGGTGHATYLKATGNWLMAFDSKGDPALNTGRFGTGDLSAQDLFQLTMNGRGAVVKKVLRNPDGGTTTILLEKETEAAREKQNIIKAEWKKWLWEDAARADRIATLYNEKMNRIVNRSYDGSHLTFPGANPAIQLLRHQKDAVWRGLQSYQVLYDHVVGAGKTFVMATLAMEMRRLGIARKPLIVVPNHLTLQWRSEFTRLYPGSNILAATPDDFSEDNRERLFAKIITGDWDAVVIGHSSLKKIGLPAETEAGVLREQIEELTEAIEKMKRARGDRRITADMEKIRKNLEAKMTEKLAAIGKRSKMVTFDELGIDAMFVDEMHEFKNLTYNSTMDRNPGMGNPAGSSKAFDMFVKVRWLFDTFGEKTPFVTATGTPVSNSLVEMFNMQRYMQYPTLKREGLNVFDAWAKQFGSVESLYEVAPSGAGYRQSSRFAKFTNLPGLMSLYNTFADTITLDDLKAQEEARGNKFPVPKMVGGKPDLVVSKRSPQVAALMGVPEAEVDDYGSIKFKADLDEPIEIALNDKTGKWGASVGKFHLGYFETEEDARLKVAETAISPVITTDPLSIIGRFGRLKELTKATKGKVNALSLTGEANKAGLDFRLINPAAPDFPGSKINLAVENMLRVYRQWDADKGAQLVFCDLSIPLSARASYSSKARRLYVRDETNSVVMLRGTMHALQGHEDVPYFVVQRGKKESRRFDVYDAVSGLRVKSDMRSKQDAIDSATEFLGDESKRQKWIDARESIGEISQGEIDEYNNDNDIEVEDLALFFTRDDIAGMSGASNFSVYDDIKAKLIAKGIPEREIAFIHDYSTPTAKDRLFKAVNNGDVRFLLGSTPKMGAGTNVQKRLVGLHHIDAPWRPSDLEQREGRIIRRGNELYARDPEGFEVYIGRYATEQTYDTRRWQILEHKARGIEQLRNFDGTINEIEDVAGEAANSADMKAAASGDPLILEETKARNDVRRLEQLQAGHADEVLLMTRKARDAQRYVDETGPGTLRELGELIDITGKNPLDKDGIAPMSINRQKPITDKDAVHKELTTLFNNVRNHLVDSGSIKYRGLEFSFQHQGGYVALITPTGFSTGWASLDPFSPSGMVQRLKNYIDRLPAIQDETRARIEKAKVDAVALREQSAAPFQQASELDAARESHKAIQRALMSKGPQVPENQKKAVDDGIKRQVAKLRELGFGDALDELGYTNAPDYDSPKEKLSRGKGAGLSRNAAGSGIAMRDMKAVVARVSKEMDNLPAVHVFASPHDLDENDQDQKALRDYIEQAGAMDDVEGATHNGEIYLFASGLADEERAEHVLATHEVTHYGLRAVFGTDLDAVLQSIWANNAGVRKQATELRKRLDLKSNVAAVEEVLADMKPAELVKLKGWRKLVGVVRDWFNSHGFTALADRLDGWLKSGLTDQQQADMLVADVVNAARDWVKGGKRAGKVGSGTALQRVFHGTPHTFMPEPGFPHGRQRLDKIALLERNGEKLDAMREAETSMSRTGDTITVDGKERSRLNSNGKPIAQTEEGLRNFWRWFGDSRVVDDQGRPLVVYHGTGATDISEFKASKGGTYGGGVYLTPEVRGANDYAIYRGAPSSTVYPVYATIKNPASGSEAAQVASWKGEENARAELIRRGYDGVVDMRSGEIVAFTSTQIKSATGNIGTFDGGNADIRFSRASQSKLPGVPQSPPVQPPSQQAMPLQGGAIINSSVWNRPEPSKMDDIIFKLQDKHIDLKRAIQGIADAGRQIADKWNAYMQEELFHGRTAKRVQDFADRELAPMLREMALRKVSIADLDKYLWARHAKEANALIEQRDPGVMVDDVTGQPKGSGMTDQEADDYFAGLSTDQRNQLAAIARQVDRMIARTRDLYVSYGLEGRDVVQGWADMFQHYVPLMREDHDGGMGIGQGFSIKGREAKHRTGSTRAVADVLANIATQREKAIVRGEKNRVAVSLAGLVKLNPAPGFWTLNKIPQERVLNEKTGLVETREVPNYRTRDNVIIAKIKDSNGNVKERAIVLNENDERAVRLAKSMKNIDIPMLEGWLGSTAAVTRYFSAINTQYNPVFGVVNLIRDVGAGALNLSSTALKGKERVVTNPRRIASAVAGIYSDARKERKGQVGTSPWATLWEEFTDEGGQTGYRDMFRTSNERANAMQQVMDPTSWTESKWGQFFTANGTLKVPLVTVQKAATPLFNWLSDFNLAMENAVRLSAYKEAVDSGMSKQQAASLAKNLTVNFNRKGAWGAQAGALYAFFNAATQGTARIGETLTRRDYKTGKYSVSGIGKKIIGGGVMLGVMQAVALAMAGFGDDEPPEFIRERNIVIPLMDGKYVSIPMPLGFHVIPNIGRITAETVMGRRGSAVEAVIDLAGITFDAFNPMGSAGWSMQTVAPTILDPMAAIIENKDWTGKPIAKEKFSNSDPTPGFDMAKDNASAISTGIAYAINMATGGTDYTAGRVSPTPDQLDYLWGQVTGGVGREGNKLYQSIESMFTGEDLPPHKIPLAGRLYGNTQSASAISARFYDNVRDMKRHKAEYMGRMEDGDTEGAMRYLADNPVAEMIRVVSVYESRVQQLRSAKRKAIEQGATERVKEIELMTGELMERFNQQMESAKQ